MEVSPRAGGNRLAEILNYAADVDIIEAEVCASVGLPLPDIHEPNYNGYYAINVLHSENDGDIHFGLYIPENYNGSEPYALYVTLPGYEGLYFQGVGVNIRAEDYGIEAKKYNPPGRR